MRGGGYGQGNRGLEDVLHVLTCSYTCNVRMQVFFYYLIVQTDF